MVKKQEDKPDFLSYQPTRLEYFAARILQGRVTGRAERDLKTAVATSIRLAEEMEKELGAS